MKARDASNQEHVLYDSERTFNSGLITHSASGEFTSYPPFSSWDNDGFTLNTTHYATNNSTLNYVAWSWRQAPGFFDVVTYTGNQTTRTIAHNLGSVPGMVVVKKTSGSGSWEVYHRSTGNEKTLRLNSSNAQAGTTAWNDTTPTSTHFTLSSSTDVNETGSTYVAYIFAHDDASFGTGGNESIIKCGTFTIDASGKVPNTNLGFEPQWILTKRTDSTGQWFIYDNMRGIATGGNDSILYPNLTNAEDATANTLDLTSTGFTGGADGYYSGSGTTYIYMAIRRPHKPPEVATEVFAVNLVPSDSTYVTTGFPVDFGWQKTTGDTWDNFSFSRLQGSGRTLRINSAVAESSFGAGPDFDSNTQMQGTRGIGAQQQILFGFKRAPGFMDVVAYSGFGSNSGTSSNISHNLNVAPQLILVKSRDDVSSLGGAGGWHVYHSGVNKEFLYLNTNASGGSPYFITASTSTTFTVRDHPNTGYTGYKYVAYLFATLPGISKVGSYTGTGSAINVDCGFTAGARFVLIKRTDSTGDWYVWDTASGIVSGNDPYLLLNSTAAEVTNTDYIDPLSTGFTVTSSAPLLLTLVAAATSSLQSHNIWN
jgi:hypothetical protein